jgi:hypothetical protein
MANGDYLPTVYQPQPNVTIYTPRKRSSGGTYRAYDSTPKPPKPPKQRKPRARKQKSMLPAVYDPNLESLAQNSEKAERRRDLAVGKQLQKEWNAAEKLKMKQLRAEQRAQEKHARAYQKAKARSMRKHKKIARKIWRRLI